MLIINRLTQHLSLINHHLIKSKSSKKSSLRKGKFANYVLWMVLEIQRRWMSLWTLIKMQPVNQKWQRVEYNRIWSTSTPAMNTLAVLVMMKSRRKTRVMGLKTPLIWPKAKKTWIIKHTQKWKFLKSTWIQLMEIKMRTNHPRDNCQQSLLTSRVRKILKCNGSEKLTTPNKLKKARQMVRVMSLRNGILCQAKSILLMPKGNYHI